MKKDFISFANMIPFSIPHIESQSNDRYILQNLFGYLMKIAIIIVCILSMTYRSSAQFDFLPSGLNVAPLRTNTQEPRVGVFKFLDQSDMKVDIGNSIDIFGYDLPASDTKITAGIDFMAYALTTGAQGLRLQIDAVDGFFGGNLSCSKLFDNQTLQIRLRILHHSAHFVDGHYLISTQQWIDNKEPIPFTQDFGELVIAHIVHPEFGLVRYYGGFSYATLVRPDVIQRESYLAGTEIVADHLIGKIAGQSTNLYLSYTVTLIGTPVYQATHNIQLGVKCGSWFGKGPSIYVGYYAGRNMFGEYFNQNISTIGAGFTVDFF